MNLAHFKILIFSNFSSMGVGLKKESQNFVIHSKLQIFYALVQNSLRYVNIMSFESILGACLFKTGMFQRIKN